MANLYQIDSQLKLSLNSTSAPLNIAEQSAAPSGPVSGDIYLDDGTNTASGNPGWRRYTGATWEDIAAGSAGSPTDTPYVTTAANSTTTAERVLTGTANQLVVTDDGVSTGTVTLSTPQDLDVKTDLKVGSLVSTGNITTTGNINATAAVITGDVAAATGTFSGAITGASVDVSGAAEALTLQLGNSTAVWKKMTAWISTTHNHSSWVEIYKDGSTANQFTIDADTLWGVDARIMGATASLAKRFDYTITGTFQRVGSTTSVETQTLSRAREPDDASYNAQIAANNTANALQLQVRDADGTGDVVLWTAALEYIQVSKSATAGPASDGYLLETGDYMLLESGDYSLLE